LSATGAGGAAEALRILQLYPKGDFFTGAAIQVSELALGLRRRGHHVVVVTRESREWEVHAREAGLPHYALPIRSEVHLGSVRPLVRILREHRIQVIHAQKGKARTLALMAGLFTRQPVLVLNRGVSFPLDRFRRLGYTTRRVDAIVAVCESIKHGLVAAGVAAEKIEVIHSGTDIERFHPGVSGDAVRRELALAPEDFLVTQVGVRSTKGNDDVIDAFALVAEHARCARLLVVGARDPTPLVERARTRGIAGAVRVVGYRRDIPEILKASDVCVDASWAGHGLTGTLREALAVETPVIATDLEGNPELVRHGETGLLVKPRDVAGLARAVLETAADRARATAMARAGQRLVVASFSTRVKLDRTEALYRRLTAARRSRP
jgi:glycosyltransferase involved in cell wall biosynthesis